MDLTGVGVWSSQLRYGNPDEVADAAVELDGNKLLRSGFTADEVSSVSDRVFEAIIAWGDEEAVLRR